MQCFSFIVCNDHVSWDWIIIADIHRLQWSGLNHSVITITVNSVLHKYQLHIYYQKKQKRWLVQHLELLCKVALCCKVLLQWSYLLLQPDIIEPSWIPSFHRPVISMSLQGLCSAMLVLFLQRSGSPAGPHDDEAWSSNRDTEILSKVLLALLIDLCYEIILGLCWSGALSRSPKYYLACFVSRLRCFASALKNLLFIFLQLF